MDRSAVENLSWRTERCATSRLRPMRPPFRPILSRHAPDLKTSPIHPAEQALTGVLMLWLGLQTWAFGAMHPPTQWAALGLAALAFALALHPRNLSDLAVKLVPSRILWRLPGWWLGVALLAYVAIQALNPGWIWRIEGSNWWAGPREAISWLPSGIEAPFEKMNTWRMLVILGSPVLAGTAIWLGITRRRSVQVLATFFVLNACAIAILGVAQRFTGTNHIFWTYAFKAEIFGTFIYRNHAAAFLLLGIAAALGLAFRHYLHGEVRGARSTPAPVFAFLAVLLTAAVVVSTSRQGAVWGAILIIITCGAFAWRLTRSRIVRRALPFVAAVVVVGFGTWSLSQADLSRFFARMRGLAAQEGEASLQIRLAGAEMTRLMFRDHVLFGMGAGSFRHVEPHYAQRIPQVTQEVRFWSGGDISSPRYWLQYTHNDHLQVLAELGLLGGALVYALVAGALAALTARGRSRHPFAVSIAIGVLTLLGFAVFDFPFANPAVLSSAVFLVLVAARWAELETAQEQ
jgi:O-antigen ligase